MPDYGFGMRVRRTFLNQLLPDFVSARSGSDRSPAPTETSATPAAAVGRSTPRDRKTVIMLAVLVSLDIESG
jgi:hypothetical protein